MYNQETQVSSHSATLAPIDSTWRKACTLESDPAVHNTAQSHLYSAYTAYVSPRTRTVWQPFYFVMFAMQYTETLSNNNWRYFVNPCP